MVTPIIERISKSDQGHVVSHGGNFGAIASVATLMTRELVDLVKSPDGESDYVSGLIHDVGKIVMSSVSRNISRRSIMRASRTVRDLIEIEREILGMDHAELGGLYLKKQRLPDIFVEVAQFHHDPTAAVHHRKTVAAVQVADQMIRHTKIGDSGNRQEVPADGWKN